MRCQECRTARHKKLFDDPREPPLDDKPCLCLDCAHNMIDACIEEHRDAIAQLEQQRRQLEPR